MRNMTSVKDRYMHATSTGMSGTPWAKAPTDLHGILAVTLLGREDYWAKEEGFRWFADKKSWNEICSAFDRSTEDVDTVKITEELKE